MPLFRCDTCGCIENTALGEYWLRDRDGKPVLCSECHTGTWHGRFKKRSAAGMMVDQIGFLWTEEQSKSLPSGYRIVGRVPADP